MLATFCGCKNLKSSIPAWPYATARSKSHLYMLAGILKSIKDSFAAWTPGEEKILVKSDYFAVKPSEIEPSIKKPLASSIELK